MEEASKSEANFRLRELHALHKVYEKIFQSLEKAGGKITKNMAG